MTNFTFDTLASSKRLKAKGVSAEQAEAIAEEIRSAQQVDLSGLATKEDIYLVKQELEYKLKELEMRMTIKLGGLMIGILTFFKILEKFF